MGAERRDSEGEERQDGAAEPPADAEVCRIGGHDDVMAGKVRALDEAVLTPRTKTSNPILAQCSSVAKGRIDGRWLNAILETDTPPEKHAGATGGKGGWSD